MAFRKQKILCSLTFSFIFTMESELAYIIYLPVGSTVLLLHLHYLAINLEAQFSDEEIDTHSGNLYTKCMIFSLPLTHY